MSSDGPAPPPFHRHLKRLREENENFFKTEWEVERAVCRLNAGMQKIVQGKFHELCFEELYRLSFNLTMRPSRQRGALVQKVLRHALRAALASPTADLDNIVQMMTDVTMYQQKTWVKANGEPDVPALLQRERERKARRVLSKLPRLWREFYLAPGGPHERNAAQSARWSASP